MPYFSKEKYFETQGTERYDSGASKGWVDYCDGHPVTHHGSFYTCQPDDTKEEYYVIHPNWVKEDK